MFFRQPDELEVYNGKVFVVGGGKMVSTVNHLTYRFLTT